MVYGHVYYVSVYPDAGRDVFFGGWIFFFQAEDGIRDLVRSRGLGDVYKRQDQHVVGLPRAQGPAGSVPGERGHDQPGALRPQGLSLIHI